MWRIREELSEDAAAVEAVVDLGFGPGRYAKTAYRLREGVLPESRLSFVAIEEATAELLGSVRFWPIAVGGAASLLLGPLAVKPELRGKGIGLSLMRHGLTEAKRLGYESVILVGDEPYYARVGFARLKPGSLRFPGPVDDTRILGIALKDGALEKLSGNVGRARVDIAVSAPSVPLR